MVDFEKVKNSIEGLRPATEVSILGEVAKALGLADPGFNGASFFGVTVGELYAALSAAIAEPEAEEQPPVCEEECSEDDECCIYGHYIEPEEEE